jgi:predicted naringenin-chalcone synthase
VSLEIAGLGTAVPPNSIRQQDAAELSTSFCHEAKERSRGIKALYRRTGVRKRHSVLLDTADGPTEERQSFYPPASHAGDSGPTTGARMSRYEVEAPTLAVQAARRAIEASGIAAGEITHSITVSCTGFHAPGVDAALIEQLGLSRSVERTHVGFMGCHGALNGIRVANSFADASPDAKVLVSAVELCSLHFFYGWDVEKMVANALFADGAGALVGVAGEGSVSDTWRVTANGTFLIPGSEDAMSWRIGDHGFYMTLSPQVPGLIKEHVPAWMEGWLSQHGLEVADVRTWAVHPGGPRILSSFGEAMGLPKEMFAVSRNVLAEHGNMSSATMIFILERLMRMGAPTPCVAVGFGPGMVVEAALVE